MKTFNGTRIAVIGDLMLDRFMWGENTRLSPEAPVPVVSISRETTMLGGAGNVAANIVSLGGTPVLFGVVGEDTAGEELRALLSEQGIETLGIVSDPERPTTEKVRIVGNEKQIVRVDRESAKPLSETFAQSMLRGFERCTADVIVLSDYAKGVFNPSFIAALIEAAAERGVPVVADMKPVHIPHAKGIALLTSNKKEVLEAARTEDMETAGATLAKELGSSVLVTRGESGMSLFEDGAVLHFPTRARAVADVAGAGDTVTAAIALALAAGLSKCEAAEIANKAAGIVVGKAGVATVSHDELTAALL